MIKIYQPNFSNRCCSKRFRLFIVLLLCLSAAPSGSLYAASFVNLVTPLELASPRVPFHEGKTQNGQPLINPALPSLPGTASDWYVAQWQQPLYLSAGNISQESRPDRKSWQFTVPDRRLSLKIAREPRASGYVYNLFERGGLLTDGGGSNLFLATNARKTNTDFSKKITLSVNTRVTTAVARYNTPAAELTGAVQAMAFTGIGLMFVDPNGGLRQFVFMQVSLTSSRSSTNSARLMCRLAGDQPQLLYAPDVDALPFKQTRRTRHMLYDLSTLVDTMISHPYPCGGRSINWSAAERIVANWHFTGLYIGLEVQDQDLRLQSATRASQGTAQLGLEIAAVSVKRFN